ncbi:MAG TPA: hypothetical protein VGI40_19970 [Pirellulaceae bacterium]|jgi:hypothetical protein
MSFPFLADAGLPKQRPRRLFGLNLIIRPAGILLSNGLEDPRIIDLATGKAAPPHSLRSFGGAANF